jgi:hypothetical protein
MSTIARLFMIGFCLNWLGSVVVAEEPEEEKKPPAVYRGDVAAHIASQFPKPGETRRIRTECPGHGPYYDTWSSPDYWSQPYQDGSYHTFASDPIPAGFFGLGSDPFADQVKLKGGPLCDTEFGDFDLVDTIIERSDDPFDECTPPLSTASVDIHIVALNLVSAEPITVTYNGGQNPEQWDVMVGLSEVPAPMGTLWATKQHCSGGEFTSELYIQPKFTFTRGDPPSEVRVLDTGLPSGGSRPPDLLEQLTPIPWAHRTEDPVDPCTHFFTLVDASPVELMCLDCNDNEVADACDIDTGTSQDQNLNGRPDECEIGACCDPVTGACVHEALDVCTGSGKNFAGEGTLCGLCPDLMDFCDDDADCNPPDPGSCKPGICPDWMTPCATDADCTPPNPGSCLLVSPCATSACCEDGTGACDHVGSPGECTGQFVGFGTDCYPVCCEQPTTTGWPTCQAADDPGNLLEITVPYLGNPPGTFILSGDSSSATSNSCPMLGTNAVMWHAFSLDDCANVTIDLCCTDPPNDPTFDLLFDACPCGAAITATESGRNIACYDGNMSATFKLLGPGTYYYPIHAGTGQASVGPYQLHITVEPCPIAACCVSNDCSMLTELACDQAEGHWLEGVVWCGVQPDCDAPGAWGVCCEGACCLGDGECLHDVLTQIPMDEELCDIIGGTFHGGAQCGTCFGSLNTGAPCYEDAECPGGDCVDTMPCPPLGACCYGDDCEDTDSVGCFGEFHEGVPCSVQPCDPPGPCVDCYFPDAPECPSVELDADQCFEFGGVECNQVGDPPLEDPTCPDMGCGTKNRYLSFQAGEPEQSIAIRVTFAEMPAVFDYAEGRQMWVQEPFQVSETAGSDGPTPPPTFWAATLGCDPFYTDWSVYGTVDVYHRAIVPLAEFDVQWIAEACSTDEECLYSLPLRVVMSAAGDVVGSCAVTPCTPPDCVVNFIDIPALVDKFSGAPGAPRKARADLIGAGCTDPNPNRKVDFLDIGYAVDAFRGAQCTLPGPLVTDPCAP